MELGYLILGDARVAERSLYEADERVEVLARALDFGSGYVITVMTRSPPSARPDAALGCGVWCRKDRADGGAVDMTAVFRISPLKVPRHLR